MSENAVATINPFGAVSAGAGAPRGAMTEALVQREVAEVQAAMLLAKKFPRDPIAAMDRILNSCSRQTLAESGMYQYSRGGSDVTGPSIRLAETLAQGWGNLLCGVAEVSRGTGSSECLAYAWDLETGFRDEKRFTVRHWRDTKAGGRPLTDERDIYELIANMGARRKRACLLTVIPGDVVEAAVRQCEVTLHTKAEVTEDRIKSLLEKFATYGVTKEQIEKRIQRRIESLTPALLVSLGKVYNSLRDGMSAPSDWFEVAATDAAGAPDPGSKVAEINAKVAAAKAAKAKAPAPDAAPTFATIAEVINSATGGDDLDTALSLIHDGLPEDQRAELAAMAKVRRGELA